MKSLFQVWIIILLIGVALLVPLGWGWNIYKLTECDFKEPFKAEVIRGVGIFVFPVGVVTGYLDIEDK